MVVIAVVVVVGIMSNGRTIMFVSRIVEQRYYKGRSGCCQVRFLDRYPSRTQIVLQSRGASELDRLHAQDARDLYVHRSVVDE
jgi:hypothetical protein